MALFNHAKHEINAKIVYFGPEGSGKRTSLQYIYDRVKPSLRGELKTLPTGGESLFFFDFNPFEKPLFGGYQLRFHMYCLTGKVSNPAAWKMTIKGADGLVVVADGAPGMISTARESISQLREHLAAYGAGLRDIPCVLQITQTGADRQTSADGIAEALDLAGVPACLSVPASGEGVLETLSLLSRMIMTRIGQDDALRVPDCEPVPGREDQSLTAETGATVSRSVAECPQRPEADGGMENTPVMCLTGQEPAGGEELKVVLAEGGATCSGGLARIPLVLTIGGESRRLVVSVAFDQD